MWRKFHLLRCSVLKDVWKSFLASLHVNCEHQDPLLMQCIFDECFNFVIIKKFGMEENPVKIDNLSDNEHNALRYTVGYVPFCLMKKLTKGSHANKDDFLRCLSEMRITGDDGSDVESELEDFLAFTKKWVKVTNRGGLFIIKDNVYLFFLMLELKLRKLQPSILQKTSKNKVITEIMTSDDVKLQWCIIAPHLKDERASQELLKLITELWITIRCFSQAGSYLENYKQCTKLATRKATGLRKGLKRKRAVEEEN